MLNRKLVTAPTGEPLSLAEVKSHCKIDHDEDDGQRLPALITAARQHIEAICSRALLTQTWDLFLDEFPSGDCLYLPLGALQSVASFSWTDSGGTTRNWTVSGQDLQSGTTVVAHINSSEEPAEIELVLNGTWPSDTLKSSNPIKVRFTCGYGNAASVPGPIKQAMLMLIDHLYYNTAATASTVSRVVQFGVDALLANYVLRPEVED